MLFKRFNFLVVFRLALIIGNVILIGIILGDKRLFFNQIILGSILVIQIIELIRFVNHTNRELTRFFLAIRHSDFSITFRQAELGKSFKELQQSMVDVIDAYKQVKIEKEGQFHFLQMLVNQLQIGLIALENDDITLINPTAESLLGISGLKNWRFVRQLNPGFANQVHDLGDNGKKLVEMRIESETKFLSVTVSSLITLGRHQKLITVQDINSEIEQKEIEAWHKLIRILTHEIMNSVTPISSLTETIQTVVTGKDGNQKQLADITTENISDIRFALQTIQKRSDGLLTFIDNYRKLTRVPQPKPQKIIVSQLLASVKNLMNAELEQKGISLAVTGMQNLTVVADPVLLEQVLINLITNSIHALQDRRNGKITIESVRQNHHIVISVADNGRGISQKEISEIFTPFFSTRKEGSGIGLSLSKQIISMHGGSIKVKSEAGVGTTMLLYLRDDIQRNVSNF
jgi:two-component system, NtrC family, nitrogen regulation sensor histidine kinase NtrY